MIGLGIGRSGGGESAHLRDLSRDLGRSAGGGCDDGPAAELSVFPHLQGLCVRGAHFPIPHRYPPL